MDQEHENTVIEAEHSVEDPGRLAAAKVLGAPAICLFARKDASSWKGRFASAHAELDARCFALGLSGTSVDDAHALLGNKLQQALESLFKDLY